MGTHKRHRINTVEVDSRWGLGRKKDNENKYSKHYLFMQVCFEPTILHDTSFFFCIFVGNKTFMSFSQIKKTFMSCKKKHLCPMHANSWCERRVTERKKIIKNIDKQILNIKKQRTDLTVLQRSHTYTYE